jgi:hypothetical protein
MHKNHHDNGDVGEEGWIVAIADAIAIKRIKK